MLISADANDSFIIEETSTFDFGKLSPQPSLEGTVARPNKPSLSIKLDIGGPTLSDGADYSGSHALYQDVVIPAVQDDVTIPRTNKPSLVVKFDIGGPTGSLDGEYVLTGTQQGADTDGASPAGRTDGVFTVVLPSLPQEDEVLVAFEHGATNALLGVHDGRDFLV